ncbi:iron complex transport system permease protein [Lutimaribacter pacificus]|uniref:Iron complex transport system permease protein n=1 Tax=Lutimaribacter pacificus TaxID=391948 RepID=A0A1H0D5F0_9RHOB|nr:iron chelate uptake ABC transporter family permease subunit [Lutimaribacter pacificus]SDN65394.1 iron complex transport system permease protein [Lutimaribacter pacificus]SHJ36614.1 iron complex transport system permease protein [Lutimaribacter pacificus]
MARVVFAAVLAGLILVSLGLGAASLAEDGAWLLMVSRFPRTAAALLAGAGLALAGVVVQQAVQNRLVEPSLTGTPEAAMLGMLAVTLIAPGLSVAGKMLVAAASALAGMAGFLALAERVPRQDPMLLPIVGLIYGAILGAVATWAAWYTDLMQYLGIWRLGEFSGVMQGRYEWLWVVAGLAVLLYAVADRITILGLGEAQARSLGLDFRQTRGLGLVIVSVLTALVLVTVGAFPFVGLVAPNLVSRWRGDNLRANLPLIAGLGGTLVLAADVIGRLVGHPFEIPAATVFAVFGAGVFLWLLHAAPGRSHG